MRWNLTNPQLQEDHTYSFPVIHGKLVGFSVRGAKQLQKICKDSGEAVHLKAIERHRETPGDAVEGSQQNLDSIQKPQLCFSVLFQQLFHLAVTSKQDKWSVSFPYLSTLIQ